MVRNCQSVILFLLQFLQEKLTYECVERGQIVANIKAAFFSMIETYENLIEQCFNTGLMRIEMDRKKGKMLEIDYIQAIEKLQNELKKKDLWIDGLKKSSDLMKLEKNNALVKAQAALSKVGSAELMIKQLKDYIALINVNRQQ